MGLDRVQRELEEGLLAGGRAVLLSSTSRFSCRWCEGEEGTAVLEAGREAPDAGSSLSMGGVLAICVGAVSVAACSVRH